MTVLINGKCLCSHCFSFVSNTTACACGYADNEKCLLPNGAVLAGKYIVGSCVRSNGVVAEYLGYDVSADCRVRIKEFFPTLLVRRGENGGIELSDAMQMNAYNQTMQFFMQDIQFLSALGNGVPVVQTRQAFYENNTVYLIVSETGGLTVREFIRRGARLDQRQTASVLRDMLFVANCVHERNRIHGNLTADTVFITSTGAVLDGFEPTEETLAAAVRDPRRTVGGAEGLPAADIFSIGWIACALLTGSIPETAFRETPQIGADTLAAQVSDTELLRVLQNMCRVGSRTYSSAAEAARELTPVFLRFGLPALVLSEHTVRTAELPAEPPRSGRNRRINIGIAVASAAAVILILALAAGLYDLIRADRAPEEAPTTQTTVIAQIVSDPETESTEAKTEAASESETENTTTETTTKKEETGTTKSEQTSSQDEETKTTHKLTPEEQRSLRERRSQIES